MAEMFVAIVLLMKSEEKHPILLGISIEAITTVSEAEKDGALPSSPANFR